MSIVASGVMMRIGTYDVAVYPDRTMRSVHRARKDEAVSFAIVSDDQGLHLTDGDRAWPHYRYTFTYRYLGRAFSVTWRCGESYGSPKAVDGLRSAFSDSALVAWEAFGVEWMRGLGYDPEFDTRRAHATYRAAERMLERLKTVFGPEYDAWEQATAEQ